MTPIDYCVELAEGRIPPPANLDIATIQEQELAMMFGFHVNQYLSRRAADWRDRGFDETLCDFAALNARSKFGATTAAPASRIGKRLATPVTLWAGAKASTSASCFANSCAAST